MLQAQTLFPKKVVSEEISLISTLGLVRSAEGYRHHPEWSESRQGREWSWRHICRQPGIALVAGESYGSSTDQVAHTKWEDYIKISFCLRGRNTTVLDGFGQHQQRGPEVLIISGPPEMLKVDMEPRGTQTAAVSLCLQPSFFPLYMGLAVEELPEPLRTIVMPEANAQVLHRLDLTSALAAATRAVLSAPCSVRRQAHYCQAKSVELMYLLLDQMSVSQKEHWRRGTGHSRRDRLLHEARELLAQRYAQNLTLEQISKAVGLNRLALTSGFRKLFGISVHECLQVIRMERAFELLQDRANTISQVAEAVGYQHACTFSTAFRAHFGCSPREVRVSNP